MTSAAITEVDTNAADETRRAMFLRLMAGYQGAIERLAAAYVSEAADREDLFQEIATALWQAIPQFRGESSERTWLYRVAHNTAITASMKLRRRNRVETDIDSAPEPRGPSDAADDRLIREQKREQMVQAIRALPSLDRQLILLHLEGLSHAEIQEISGLSEGAIATRLSRIRDRLAQEIRRKEGGKQ